MTEQNTSTISELQQKANDGDAQAQFKLALCYANGTKVERDTSTAPDYLKKSAEQGNANAQFAMGLSYFLCSYYFTDENQTEEPYKLAQTLIKKSTVNNLLSILQLVLLHAAVLVMTCDSGNNLAFKWFKKSAKQNNLKAIYWLGQCFRNGIGTEQNDVQAVDCFKNAANQGEVESQCLLAYCLLEGRGIAQSNDQAINWLKQSAEQGNVEAEYELYHCYLNGKAVEKSETIALKLFVTADQQGVTDYWFKQASERGRTKEQFYFSSYYLYGKGVTKNYGKGMQWMIETAKQSGIEANNWLFNSYLALIIPTGLLDQADIEACYDYLFNWCTDEAIGYDTIIAKLLLGVLYSTGKGVKQNDEIAFEYFSKAYVSWKNVDVIIPDVNYGGSGDRVDDYINIFLSNCYAQGKGVKKNLEKAKSHSLNYEGDIVHQVMGQSFTEGETKDIEGEQTNHRRTLLLLKLNILIFSKKYTVAKGFVNKIFENTHGMDVSFKNICLETIKQAEILDNQNHVLKEKSQELNNMIAMFAHNFLGTLQCIRSNAEHDNNPNIHLRTVKMMGGALTAFSILSADDNKLIEQLKQDKTGESSLQQSLSNNLALAISQLLSKTNKDKIITLYLKYLCQTQQIEKDTTGEELRSNKIYRKKWQAVQHQWEDEFNALFSEQVELPALQAWIADNFFPIKLVGFDEHDIHFKEFGITDSIFLVIFMEIIVNALKYIDVTSNEPLTVILCKQGEYYKLLCENPSSQGTGKGTHKGIDFLDTIAKKLNGYFSSEFTENSFKTVFIIPSDLLK